MIVLAVESATDAVGAALLMDDGSVVERVHVGGREHAERLAPSIEEVCAGAGCALDDVTMIAVDVGPGLFTGLRVGVATAKALGHGLGRPLFPISSLDILAASAFAADADAPGDDPVAPSAVAAVVDARRGEVFAATYENRDLASVGHVPAGGHRAGVTDPGEAVDPNDLPDWFADVADRCGGLTVVGSGAVRYAQVLGPVPGVDLGRAERFATPSPGVLARLTAGRLAAGYPSLTPGEVVPDYRRPADARINWEQRTAPARPPS